MWVGTDVIVKAQIYRFSKLPASLVEEKKENKM